MKKGTKTTREQQEFIMKEVNKYGMRLVGDKRKVVRQYEYFDRNTYDKVCVEIDLLALKATETWRLGMPTFVGKMPEGGSDILPTEPVK